MATIANRGKWAEARVKKFLKVQEERADAAHYRFPDARSGSLMRVPCDFMFLKAGKLTLVEVKEVNHDFRLPHTNFSEDKVARMRLWQLAGASACVLVYHRTSEVWRILDASFFYQRTGGSWDLSSASTDSENAVFTAMVNWTKP